MIIAHSAVSQKEQNLIEEVLSWQKRNKTVRIFFQSMVMTARPATLAVSLMFHPLAMWQ
tara:strand:+ start:229 stop:405 length:177 start_codon:yes stop_codon:yes gene_type:complete